jgi:hypothetical protein
VEGPGDDLPFGQESFGLCQHGFKISAVDILLDQVAAIVLAEIVIDLDDPRVTEGGEDVSLALKVALYHRSHLGICGSVEHLFGDAQTGDFREAHVLDLVDCAHAANPQYSEDAIAPLEDMTIGQPTLGGLAQLHWIVPARPFCFCRWGSDIARAQFGLRRAWLCRRNGCGCTLRCLLLRFSGPSESPICPR